MKYYISETPLKLREYGRHVQSMIERAIITEDREQRQRLANEIIRVMVNLNPQIREFQDWRQKLWDYLFIASGGKLDVDYPFEKPDYKKLEYVRPPRMPYFHNTSRYRQYGWMVQQMVKKAVEMEPGPQRQRLINYIANTMRQVLRNMDREAPSEVVVVDHIRELSQGKLIVSPEELVLHKALPPVKPPSRHGHYKNNNNNNNRNRKRKKR